MYCNETIKRIIFGINEDDNGDFPLVCFWTNPLKFHANEGSRIILVTDNWAISLGYNGVSKEPMEGFHEKNGEYFMDGIDGPAPEIEEDTPWVTAEATLFTGEKLENVSTEKDYYALKFSDFAMDIIPHDMQDDLLQYAHHKHTFDHIYGMDRLLTRKCDCGGEPQMVIEFVDDFMACCKECGKSTWACMNAIDAIEEWNAGEIGCELKPEIVGQEIRHWWDDSYHKE